MLNTHEMNGEHLLSSEVQNGFNINKTPKKIRKP